MNDPWEFLGLDRGNATEKEVKAAYARLLKQHRPEKDPEGFRKVRSAYELAMHGIKKKPPGDAEKSALDFFKDAHREKDLPAAGSPSRPGPVASSEQPPSRALQAAMEQLREAIRDGSRETLQSAWQDYVRQSRVDRMPMQQEAGALWQAFEGKVERFAEFVTAGWLLRCIELGLVDIPRKIIRYWSDTSNSPRLVALGEELVLEIRHAHAEESLQVIEELVHALVFWDAQLACDLVDLVCALIPEERAKALRLSVKEPLRLGRIFQDVPPVHRQFWKEVLSSSASPETDWDSPAAQQALAWVRQNRGTSWDGFDLIRTRVPEKEKARLDKAAARNLSGERVEWIPILLPWVGRFGALALLFVIRGCMAV